MKLKQLFLITITLVITLCASAQNEAKYSLSTGVGYFAAINSLGEKGGSSFPRSVGIYGSTGTFIEFSYKLKTGYWIGVNYLQADVNTPPINTGNIFWRDDKRISYGMYSILIKKSFVKGKHYFDISAGPLLEDFSGTDLYFDDYKIAEINGVKQSSVLNPELYNYHCYDLGLFLAAEYKYNLTRNLNIGLRSEIIGLLYIGKEAITAMPVIEVRF
jgi:hypothetical protein